jgi:Protein of unknown function (DUF3147)
MLEYASPFLAGGLAIVAFAALGDMLRPKSFAGLFGAAPSIALATLVITIMQKGASFAAMEGQSMIFGAFALAAYSWTVCVLLKRFELWSRTRQTRPQTPQLSRRDTDGHCGSHCFALRCDCWRPVSRVSGNLPASATLIESHVREGGSTVRATGKPVVRLLGCGLFGSLEGSKSSWPGRFPGEFGARPHLSALSATHCRTDRSGPASNFGEYAARPRRGPTFAPPIDGKTILQWADRKLR